MCALGSLYNTEKNYPMALKYYKMAFEHGYVGGLRRILLMEIDKQIDLVEGEKLLNSIKSQKDIQELCNSIMKYRHSEIIPIISEFAEKGSENAKTLYDLLEKAKKVRGDSQK